MKELISFGNKRNYDDFKKQIPSMVQPLFDSIREYCLSLGENVVEDIRMHRVVFGKSIIFRWFVDVEPEIDGIIIKVQKNRKEYPQIFHIKVGQEITEFKDIIQDAFQIIN
jgi:predicted transport protein